MMWMSRHRQRRAIVPRGIVVASLCIAVSAAGCVGAGSAAAGDGARNQPVATSEDASVDAGSERSHPPSDHDGAARSDDAAPNPASRARWPAPDEVGPTAYDDPDLGRPLTHGDLEPVGPVVSERDGQVIERLDVTGTISVAHDDVTIRAVRVRTTGGKYGISADPDVDVSGTTVEYVEVDGGDDVEGIGVLLDEATVRHSDIYAQRVGIQFGGGSTIESNRVYDQATAPGSHNTAISIHGGSDVVVRGNALEGSTSAALSLYPRLAPLTNILVEDNLFNGGSYCTYAGATDHEYRGQGRGIRYRDNVFGTAIHDTCGEFGPVSNYDGSRPGNEWVGNTWDTGESVG
jgi:hypothetical protein